MKRYIQPQTEITRSTQDYIMAGMSTNDEVGYGEQLTNTTTFEEDITNDKSHSLWDE